MKKYGNISSQEIEELREIINQYYKRNMASLFPCFLDGAEYVLKHLQYD